MGAAAKPPPFVCFKWPWNPNPQSSPSPSPCGDLELPWLFKSIRTLAQGLVIAGDLPSPPASATGGGGTRSRRGWGSPGAAQVEADRGDVEQRALAAALASGRPATVLEFYSPRCRLCASLQGLVRELEEQAGGSAGFVLADAEDDRWMPERRAFLRRAPDPAAGESSAGPAALLELDRVWSRPELHRASSGLPQTSKRGWPCAPPAELARPAATELGYGAGR